MRSFAPPLLVQTSSAVFSLRLFPPHFHNTPSHTPTHTTPPFTLHCRPPAADDISPPKGEELNMKVAPQLSDLCAFGACYLRLLSFIRGSPPTRQRRNT